jgi:O-antigen/teichoic acid export membrane protein
MWLANQLKLDSSYLNNIKFQSAGNVTAQVVNAASLPIIMRLFDPTEIGIMNLFIQSMALVTILISFRVEQVVVLPKEDDQASELVSFVASFGVISCIVLTIAVCGFIAGGVVPTEYRAWLLCLPVTSFLVVFAQAAQQMSQRSSDFRRSGMSEIINRGSNSLVAIGAGLAALPGVWLAVATASGFIGKLIIFRPALARLTWNLPRNVACGRTRIRKQGFEKLLGSIILSHAMLALTIIAPLVYVSHRYGSEFTGHFSLVAWTLALPTTLIGVAVGHVFYQRASQIFAQGDRFSSLFAGNVRMLTFVAVPAFLFVGLTGPEIYPFVFGAQWQIAGQTAQIYAVAAAFSFVTVPFERSGLIVNAWWYGPSWQFARLVTTLGVIYVCDRLATPYLTFVGVLAIQVALLHAVDGVASFVFSRRTDPYSAAAPGPVI